MLVLGVIVSATLQSVRVFGTEELPAQECLVHFLVILGGSCLWLVHLRVLLGRTVAPLSASMPAGELLLCKENLLAVEVVLSIC